VMFQDFLAAFAVSLDIMNNLTLGLLFVPNNIINNNSYIDLFNIEY